MKYLTTEQIFILHNDQIDKYGGSHGIRDLSLLESALYRPQTTFGGRDLYASLYDKAAVLVHSLILNHPFVDGNKRTGIIAMIVFLEINGFHLDVSNNLLVSLALNIATKKWDIEEISSWISSVQ